MADRATEIVELLKELLMQGERTPPPAATAAVATPHICCYLLNKYMNGGTDDLQDDSEVGRQIMVTLLREGCKTCPLVEIIASDMCLTTQKSILGRILKQSGHVVQNKQSSLMASVPSNEEKQEFDELVDMLLLPSLECKKEAVTCLKDSFSFRVLFGENPSAVSKLVEVSDSFEVSDDPLLQEDVVGILCDLLDLKSEFYATIAGIQGIARVLFKLLVDGSTTAKVSAAKAIARLSWLKSNRILIGGRKEFKLLLSVIDQGEAEPAVATDIAVTLHNLCSVKESAEIAIDTGVILVALDLIGKRKMVWEMLCILPLLSEHEKGLTHLGQSQTVHTLLGVIEEGGASELNSRRCLTILGKVCKHFPDELKRIANYEKDQHCIAGLVSQYPGCTADQARAMLLLINTAGEGAVHTSPSRLLTP